MASLAQEAQMHQIQEFVGYPIEKLLDCDNKPENTDTAFFTYGRFQPGHRGHETMIITMLAKAEDANTKTETEITPEKTNIYVFVSPSGGPNEKNPQKNPLTPDEKVHLLQQQYAGFPIHFVNMGQPGLKNRSAFGALSLLKNCYEKTVMVRGKEEGVELAKTLIEYGLTDAIPVERPKNSLSATELREAAAKTPPDKETFYKGIMFGGVTQNLADHILNIIRSKYGLEGGKTRRRKTRRRKTRRRKTRRRKTRRKTRKRKTKRRKTKTKRKRKKRTLRRYTIRRRKK